MVLRSTERGRVGHRRHLLHETLRLPSGGFVFFITASAYLIGHSARAGGCDDAIDVAENGGRVSFRLRSIASSPFNALRHQCPAHRFCPPNAVVWHAVPRFVPSRN